MKKKAALLLSAGFLSEDISNIYGNIPSVLLPINGKTYLEHFLDENKTFDYVFVVVNNLQYFNKLSFFEKIHLSVIEPTKDVTETMRLWIHSNNIKFDQLTILFSDILVPNIDFNSLQNKNYIYTTLVNDHYKWSKFIDGFFYEKERTELHEQNIRKDENFLTFLGLMNVTDVPTFISLIKDFDFYESIKIYSEKNFCELIYTENYFNLGHVMDLLNFRLLTTREFNNITKHGRLILKSSSDENTLENEAYWYTEIPLSLRSYLPNLYYYDYLNHRIFLEYLPQVSFHEIYLFGHFTVAQWKQKIELMFELLEKFAEFPLETNDLTKLKFTESMYLEKTIKRLNMIENNELITIMEKGFTLQKLEVPNIAQIIEKIRFNFKKIFFPDNINLNIIHGDFFLANIMFDSYIKNIRVVDPRGHFGIKSIYGDPYYDYSKLAHSFIGNYDLIVEDYFDIVISGSNYDLNFELSQNQINAREAFNKVLIERDIDLDKIKFLLSVLFFSMIPLHKSEPKRQLAMYLVATKFIMEDEWI
jgi:hypothetical protein